MSHDPPSGAASSARSAMKKPLPSVRVKQVIGGPSVTQTSPRGWPVLASVTYPLMREWSAAAGPAVPSVSAATTSVTRTVDSAVRIFIKMEPPQALALRDQGPRQCAVSQAYATNGWGAVARACAAPGHGRPDTQTGAPKGPGLC